MGRIKDGSKPREDMDEVLAEVKANAEKKATKNKDKYEKRKAKTIEKQATNLTPEERAIADRVSSEKDSWLGITEESMLDYSLGDEPYPLPPEAKEKQDKKEFAFRCVEMKKERLDYFRSMPDNDPRKWWICNSTNTPFLAKYVDSVHGGVQINDQLLMVKPWFMHKRHQDIKLQSSLTKQEAADIRKRDGRKEEWGEWRAGDSARIQAGEEGDSGSGDVVMQDMSDYDEAIPESPGGLSDVA